jgi:hypothetical protein
VTTAPDSFPPRLASARTRSARRISAEISTGLFTPARVVSLTIPGSSMKR